MAKLVLLFVAFSTFQHSLAFPAPKMEEYNFPYVNTVNGIKKDAGILAKKVHNDAETVKNVVHAVLTSELEKIRENAHTFRAKVRQKIGLVSPAPDNFLDRLKTDIGNVASRVHEDIHNIRESVHNYVANKVEVVSDKVHGFVERVKDKFSGNDGSHHEDGVYPIPPYENGGGYVYPIYPQPPFGPGPWEQPGQRQPTPQPPYWAQPHPNVQNGDHSPIPPNSNPPYDGGDRPQPFPNDFNPYRNQFGQPDHNRPGSGPVAGNEWGTPFRNHPSQPPNSQGGSGLGERASPNVGQNRPTPPYNRVPIGQDDGRTSFTPSDRDIFHAASSNHNPTGQEGGRTPHTPSGGNIFLVGPSNSNPTAQNGGSGIQEDRSLRREDTVYNPSDRNRPNNANNPSNSHFGQDDRTSNRQTPPPSYSNSGRSTVSLDTVQGGRSLPQPEVVDEDKRNNDTSPKDRPPFLHPNVDTSLLNRGPPNLHLPAFSTARSPTSDVQPGPVTSYSVGKPLARGEVTEDSLFPTYPDSDYIDIRAHGDTGTNSPFYYNF